ncbi:hypothetical protein CC80DRAFT_293847 [Byssothecium circinans]|uniref:Uncharacterized protein n=1 Tax=Byssothecium circinans TaxID=147558 RepID=A0A6A5U7X7_9PLEO|nr:hypothetical protein CC80DRAFT_293847 [Byssothecium circinans]
MVSYGSTLPYTGRPSACYNDRHKRSGDAVRKWCEEVHIRISILHLSINSGSKSYSFNSPILHYQKVHQTNPEHTLLHRKWDVAGAVPASLYLYHSCVQACLLVPIASGKSFPPECSHYPSQPRTGTASRCRSLGRAAPARRRRRHSLHRPHRRRTPAPKLRKQDTPIQNLPRDSEL